ncbi:MAG TPA: maleylpyruvate isomerase family mycothiol-dependent enzyme [Stackebrandtia sp.]|jgi:uncharacterized protein (TIGR03083 family)|uniref:maleylpyruvate isomerase family mycothiol-dependent enzyme n=1 Tax=Stackebrandtia sp. TaxID=2023065 RepID=UPI002D251BCB|nr:maleylpyruvate isomerase family mycothiol-dependent enzyme [Stackebrandtia sp.]HZE42115.1 maleylpyruvate isomerase family mycothiol-dependent enzyme [Stackebrandtia sp.]
MDFIQLTSCLTSDAAKLAEAADGKLDAGVPSCPEWTNADLLEHVAMVYNHKTECMRNGKPENWPPEKTGDTPPLTQLRHALGDLLAEFTARQPSDAAYTWYDPDQTVGFWIRRMAQETVIHRVDAEQASAVALSPIDADLAVDGIDELLAIFLGWSSVKWHEHVTDHVTKLLTAPIAVSSGGRSWLVRPTPDGNAEVTEGAGDGAVATVSGEPADVLLWLWRRAPYDSVTVDGNADAAKGFYELLSEFTG